MNFDLNKDLRKFESFFLNYLNRYPTGLPKRIPAEVFNKKATKDALELAETTINLVQSHLNI